jgi:hypothetical protein
VSADADSLQPQGRGTIWISKTLLLSAFDGWPRAASGEPALHRGTGQRLSHFELGIELHKIESCIGVFLPKPHTFLAPMNSHLN